MAEYKTKEQKKRFYNSKEWTGKNGIRQQALKRDNWECQRCKELGYVHVDSKKVEGERKSIELNVHHIKEIEDHPELALRLDNTITLCLRCHNEIHEKFKSKKLKWKDEKW
ncbi:HNH endonuclease [Priestia abyssalis]|uniref:HNH endonuclease n=1 Tax=Priestia abyssalis TaxID=1221450 RepID=UPI000995D8EF|nr:HNH endonuclease [Priestia abyssalis]